MSVVISAACIRGFGVIDDKLKFNESITPGRDLWIHIDCTGPSGATFDIITDGEKWLPLDRRTHKVSKDMNPKATVDLSKMSVLDKQLITRLIEEIDWSGSKKKSSE